MSNPFFPQWGPIPSYEATDINPVAKDGIWKASSLFPMKTYIEQKAVNSVIAPGLQLWRTYFAIFDRVILQTLNPRSQLRTITNLLIFTKLWAKARINWQQAIAVIGYGTSRIFINMVHNVSLGHMHGTLSQSFIPVVYIQRATDFNQLSTTQYPDEEKPKYQRFVFDIRR